MRRLRAAMAYRRPGSSPGRSLVARFVASTVLAAMIVPIAQTPASAAPNLTATPITWGVIGLDSNNVNQGPNQFAEGARVCNTGTSAAANVTGTFVWDSANVNVNLYGSNPLSVASLAAGACTDFYFNIQITRVAAAYNTTRQFHIGVVADTLAAISTPTPREVYVEKLVSQNRNTVQGVTGPTTVLVGNTYTYTFNSSTAPAGYEQMSTFLNWPNAIFQILSVSATYTAPAGGTNTTIYADACGWQPNPSAPNYRSCVGPVNYSGGKAGGTMATTYTIKVLSPGTANMGGMIYDFSGSSYHYNADWSTTLLAVTAVEQANLSLDKSDSPNIVTAGQNVTYTLDVANAGPSTARNVTISDPLPPGTSFVSADNGGSLSGGTVTWNLGDVAPGATPSVHLVVKVNSGRMADLSNTATVSSTTTDPNSANNSDTEATTVTTSANLSITKTDSPDPVLANDTLTYTLSAANAGPSDANAVQVSDTLPAGVTFVSATPSKGSCSQVAGVVSCSLGGVADATTETVTIVVTAPSAAGSLSNTATVSSSTPDPGSANDSDTEGTTVSPSADLSIAKSDSADPVTAGTDLTYTLVVTNAGPTSATSVVATDPVPAGTSFVSADGGGTESGGTVTWNLGTMANGASVTRHVTVHVAPGRTAALSNTASVSSAIGDPTPANDSATEATTVATSGDLAVTKTDGSGTVAAGGSTTYTITLTNNGPSTVPAGVVLTDTIPAGTTGSESESACAISAGVLACTTTAALAPGASVSWQVTVGVPGSYVPATVMNTAAVSSSPITDPAPANDSATDTDTVTRSADLSIVKTDSADPILAGQDVTYTLVVANAGLSGATNTVVTDAVPAGTSFVSADGGGAEAGGTVTWNLGTLANGATTTLHVTVHVNEARTADISNTASVQSDLTDPAPSDDADTEGTVVNEDADLEVVLADAPDPVAVGGTVAYTATVTNHGVSDAAGVVLTDTLPVGTSYVGAVPSQGSCLQAAGVVTCSLGSIADGGSATVVFVVTTISQGTVTDSASVDATTPDSNAANDADSEDTDVTPAADLSITKTDSADPVLAGQDLTYTLVVANAGPSGATNVAVIDAVPAGTSFVSADGGGVEAGGTVTWNLGSIAPGGSATVHVTVHVGEGQTANISNTASVSADQGDPDPTDNADTETTVVDESAGLSITKTDSADPVLAGNDLTYTLVVANGGPSDAVNVAVTDAVPAGTSFVSADGGGIEAGGTVTWNLGTIADGGLATVHVTVHVSGSRTANLSNTASVGSDTPDGDASDNSATETTTVDEAADLAITAADSADPVVAGQDLTYTLSVTNDGPSDATNAVVTQAVPIGTTFVSADGGGVEGGGIVTWNLGTLADGASATLHMTVHVHPDRTAALTTTAGVASDGIDPDPSNDSATEPTAVAGSADLSITKSDSADPVIAGTDLIYTLVVANDGPSDATNVVVSDPLPAGTSFVSADGGGLEAGGTVTWNLGALADGDSGTLHVTVHVNGARTADLSNTASVGSDVPDPDGTNDDATEATVVDTQADLRIDKTDGVAGVVAGGSTTYTITLTNDGPSTVPAGAVVTDTVPAGTAGSEAEADCGISAGVLACTTSSALAAGDSVSWQLTVDLIPSYASATLSNTAQVSSSPVSDPDAGNDAATDTDAVTSAADLSITKTDSADPVLAGNDLTYALVVVNDGPSDATNVVVSDPLPAGTSFVSADGGGLEAGGTVTWNVGLLADGASATVHVTVHVNEATTSDLTNTASVTGDQTDPDAANDSATEATTVDESADLSITKTDSVDPVVADSDLTYTLVVANAGPSDGTNVVVSDPLPAGTSLISVDGGGLEAGGTVTWSLGTLADGGSVTLHVTVHVNRSRTADLSNTASVSSDVSDPGGSNDEATETTAVSTSSDLSITKTDSADPILAGEDLTYTLSVSNAGPSDATNVVVSDPLPAGISFVSADGGGVEAAGTVTWNLGGLSDGASTTVHVTVHVDEGRTVNLSNTATVGADQADPDGSNDSATETTAVDEQADLSITKTDAADPVTADSDISYTLVVSNAGPSDATNVVVSDPLPAGTSFVWADAGGLEAAGVVTWNLGTLADGGSATLHVIVHVDPARTTGISNTASVTSDVSDPDVSNDDATETTSVQTVADLSITKSDSADPVLAGTDLTYTLTATNDGPSDATNVVVSDPLPTGTSFVSADAGGVEAGGTVTWNVGALANGASATLHVTVHVNEGRTADLSNTATVSADQVDPDGSNGSATESTAVDEQADLHMTKDAAATASVGADVTYTIVVQNEGPSDATGVVVTDVLAAGATYGLATTTQGTCAELAGTVTCDLGTLADGASATVTLIVTATAAGALDNTASASSDVTDPDPSDDADTVSTTVSTVPQAADLEVVKTASAGPAYVGDDITYTIVVTNRGPDTAQGVTLTDPLDTDLSFVSADQGGVAAAGVVTWNLGDIASGDAVTISLVTGALAAHPGLSNTATVASTTPDTDPSNDAGTVLIDAVEPSGLSADLRVAKTVDVDRPTSGEIVTYTVMVTNQGPSDATNVRILDHLPAGLEFRSSSANVGDYDPVTGVWRIRSLPNGATAVMHMDVRITAAADGSSIQNVARVAGLDERDPDGTNDSGQRDIVVVRGGSGTDGGTGGGTAFTGANVARTLALLFGFLAAGFIFLVAARRREYEDPGDPPIA